MPEQTEDIMDELQSLIGEELQKYHEEKIKRDMGEETGPGPGLKKAGKKSRIPHALLRQYLELN
jgi:hypothetical protein